MVDFDHGKGLDNCGNICLDKEAKMWLKRNDATLNERPLKAQGKDYN